MNDPGKVVSTANMVAQIADAAVQRGIDFAANFWNYWDFKVQPPTWFEDLQRQFITSATSIFQPDLLIHEVFYSAELALEHKVIVVAHSQGNLYANQAFSVVTALGGSTLFHIVGVATPATSVAGSGPYFTLHGDIITLVPGSLPANITNDSPSPCQGALFSVACHAFDDSYMDVQKGDHTRPAIVEAVLAFIRGSSGEVILVLNTFSCRVSSDGTQLQLAVAGTVQGPPGTFFAEFFGPGSGQFGEFTCDWPIRPNPGGGSCGGSASQSPQASWTQSVTYPSTQQFPVPVFFNIEILPFQISRSFNQCPSTLPQPVILFQSK